MAAINLLRLSRGGMLPQALSSQLLSRTTQVPFLIQKNTLALTTPLSKRIYGPPETRGNNINHWKIERVVAVALLPIIPAGLAFPNMAFDMALSAALVLHTHWGLSGVCTDYIHGEVIPKIVQPTVLLLSILAFAGMLYLNFNDIGFGKAVQKIWTEL